MGINNEWCLTTQRFVAFLDIAGTKDRVRNQTAKEIYNLFRSVVTISSELGKTDENVSEYVYYSVFSDSLIFISKDDSEESLKTFLDVVTFAFASSIRHGLPLKGAVSYGEMTADRENRIFFGQPLIDAFLLQDTILDYYGTVFDNNFRQYVNSMRMKLDSWVFDYISFYKKDIDTNIKEYFDATSWHLDWFRVLRTIYGYNINKIDYDSLHNADTLIEMCIKKIYTENNEKIMRCLNNTLDVFHYNRQQAFEFAKSVEQLYRKNGK